MKPTKKPTDRWREKKVEKFPVSKHGLSRARFYCDRCKAGFNDYDGFDNHSCGVWDINSSE